jgi:glyoxylase I family protein
MVQSVHHIGITCGNLDKSVDFYQGLLGFEPKVRKQLPGGVEVVVLEKDGVCLELFAAEAPLEPAVAGGSRNAPGFRHIALKVDNVEKEYNRLSAAGVVFTVAPRMGRVFASARQLCFCQDPDGILVELMEFED